jgi:hypothetical protein
MLSMKADWRDWRDFRSSVVPFSSKLLNPRKSDLLYRLYRIWKIPEWSTEIYKKLIFIIAYMFECKEISYIIERASLSSMSSSRAYFSFRPEVSFSLEVLSTSFRFSYVQKYKVGESRLK